MENIVLSTDCLFGARNKLDKYNTIVLGSGAKAKDLRTKFSLLGASVPPYLYGSKDDESAGIRHYTRLREIENPKECKFYLFYDSDEWTLIAPSMALINEITGSVGLEQDYGVILYALGLKGDHYFGSVDMFGNIIHSINGQYFARHGEPSDKTMNVQIWGGSGQADIFAFSEHYLGECLHSALSDYGVAAVVDVHAQWIRSVADNIPRFLSDGAGLRCDVLCMFFNLSSTDKYDIRAKNALALRSTTKNFWHLVSRNIGQAVGETGVGVGVDFDIEATIELAVVQHRIMSALARVHGFKYYACLPPNLVMLAESRNIKIAGNSPGYIKRNIKLINKFIDEASRYGKVVDLSGCFDDYDNIFPFFMDGNHMTDEGNRVAAKALAEELMKDLNGNASDWIDSDS
jgi:hypothetical protein